MQLHYRQIRHQPFLRHRIRQTNRTHAFRAVSLHHRCYHRIHRRLQSRQLHHLMDQLYLRQHT